MSTAELTSSRLEELLGADGTSLLTHECTTIPASNLHLPGPDFVDRVWVQSDRDPQVLRNLQALQDHGRLAGTGYVSILPVDQGIEHSARRVVRAEPDLLRPREHRQARASRAAATPSPRPSACSARSSRKYAHKIPFIVKLNHNEFLTLPEHATTRSCSARVAARLRHGRGRRRRDDLLRLGRVAPPDRRGRRGLRGGPRARHVHRALVLPAQQRASRSTASTTTRPPT